ncbi:MAG: DUF1003 domain-containing protein [Candidatus Acidiferrales bacterium]
MQAEIEMLREVPMFSLLDEEEIRTLVGFLEVRHIDRGETIFHHGDVGDCLYIVQQGRVEIFVETTEGQKVILAENQAGDVFGEISLLDGGARTASAVAVEETDLLTFDRENLLGFISRAPGAAVDLLTIMGKRLRSTDELLRTHVARNLNVEEEESLTFGQHIADRVATFGGSWTFILSFAAFLMVWMSFNVYLALRAFDPYPFILLNLALSALAALQAPVIMMSQNRQASKDRLKADLDYEVNLKAELEVAQLHNRVDRIYEEMQANFVRLSKELKAIQDGLQSK